MTVKLFTDVKIGHRLAMGFGITIALMALIVVAGQIYLGRVGTNIDHLVKVNNAKLKNALEMKMALSDLTRPIAEVITSRDTRVKEDAKRAIAEAREKYRKAADELEKLESSEEGKQLIASFREKVAKGKEANDAVIELGMAGSTAQAAEKFAEGAKIAASYMETADNIVAYNEKRTLVRFDETKGNISTGRTIFLGVGLLTLLVGAWLSRTITHSITIPIGRSSAHIDLMAKGDFSIPVSPHALARKDEMGIFAKSMDAMNSNLGRTLGEVTLSATNVASASAQLSVSAENLSKGAMEQVERATQVAAGSAQMNQASEDIARSSSGVATSAGQAVEVAKLSLWLRYMALNRESFSDRLRSRSRRGKPLNLLPTLTRNLKRGNSLIDDPAVAGDAAFPWQKEFPEVMQAGGFDVVIGKPTYERIQTMQAHAPEALEFLKANYCPAVSSTPLLPPTALRRSGPSAQLSITPVP